MSMQILHISDTHLGSRRYNRESREEDVYNVFHQLMEIAVREHVKAVIHTGDLFDVYKPSNRALKVFVDETRVLRENGVPFITIPGDHDTPKVREEVYPQRLLGDSLGLIKVLLGDSEKSFYELREDNLSVKIYGVRNMSNVFKERLLQILGSLKPDGDRNVLMLHQGFREMLPYDNAWQLEIGNLPKGFQYYACGHVHSRIENVLPDGSRLVVAGSPEIIREEEIEPWAKKGKGGYLVDLSGKEPLTQPINVDVRPQLVEKVRVDDVDSEIDRLLSKLQGLSSKRKPILHLILEGDSARRAVALKRLSRLEGYVDFYRVYKDETVDVREKVSPPQTQGSVEELMASYLKAQGYNEGEVKLILEAVEKYDSDEALEILRKFAEM